MSLWVYVAEASSSSQLHRWPAVVRVRTIQYGAATAACVNGYLYALDKAGIEHA